MSQEQRKIEFFQLRAALTAAQQECEKLKQTLLLMSKDYAEYTGTCPADMKAWQHPDGCQAMCENALVPIDSNCWRMYFSELVEK
jgi:hypothetical protein